MRLILDRSFLAGKAVALEFQAPLPGGTLGLGGEATAIKARLPLLAGIARLIPAGHGVGGVALLLTLLADARPLRRAQALGHGVGGGERLGADGTGAGRRDQQRGGEGVEPGRHFHNGLNGRLRGDWPQMIKDVSPGRLAYGWTVR